MKMIDIHQANVIGLGAHQFAQGLVVDIERNDSLSISEHYLHKTMNILHYIFSTILFFKFTF